jgi:hypothetical protein
MFTLVMPNTLMQSPFPISRVALLRQISLKTYLAQFKKR